MEKVICARCHNEINNYRDYAFTVEDKHYCTLCYEELDGRCANLYQEIMDLDERLSADELIRRVYEYFDNEMESKFFFDNYMYVCPICVNYSSSEWHSVGDDTICDECFCELMDRADLVIDDLKKDKYLYEYLKENL